MDTLKFLLVAESIPMLLAKNFLRAREQVTLVFTTGMTMTRSR
jgi:hypothetical protein